MRYIDFENIMSANRMGRYITACAGDSRNAMTLYRKNLKLSQELFTIVSCLEIALRNKIDRLYLNHKGADWLLHASSAGGMFDTHNSRQTKNIILRCIAELGPLYTHAKLVAKMDFGFWRYLYAQPQFYAGGQVLLQVFPSKPRSTPLIQYNHSYVFNELEKINGLRNRLAHHEPVCFANSQQLRSTLYARQQYALILELFHWMNIDEAALLYGLDHIMSVCNDIDAM